MIHKNEKAEALYEADLRIMRDRFYQIMGRSGIMSMVKISEQMGLCHHSLRSFSRGARKPSVRVYFIIKQWIEAREKELGIGQSPENQ